MLGNDAGEFRLRCLRVRYAPFSAAFSRPFAYSDGRNGRSSKKRESIQNTRLLERVVGTLLGDGAKSLAGKLHADIAALAAVELGHPDALLLKVRVHGAIHGLGDVMTDTALLLGKTGTVNAAALVGHGKRDIADSGHKIFG